MLLGKFFLTRELWLDPPARAFLTKDKNHLSYLRIYSLISTINNGSETGRPILLHLITT